MTFEAWLTKDKFKAQVIRPFEEYLEVAFREHCYLCIRYDYLLSTANNSTARKTMAHAKEAPKTDNDVVLPSPAQRSVSTDHIMNSSQSTAGKRGGTHPASLPPTHQDVVESGTGAIEGQERVAWSWLNDLRSNKQRRPDPEDDDDAEYTAGNEDVEFGAPDTSRTKSARISKQLQQATPVKLTQKAT
jgi:hypothetical protein